MQNVKVKLPIFKDSFLKSSCYGIVAILCFARSMRRSKGSKRVRGTELRVRYTSIGFCEQTILISPSLRPLLSLRRQSDSQWVFRLRKVISDHVAPTHQSTGGAIIEPTQIVGTGWRNAFCARYWRGQRIAARHGAIHIHCSLLRYFVLEGVVHHRCDQHARFCNQFRGTDVALSCGLVGNYCLCCSGSTHLSECPKSTHSNEFCGCYNLECQASCIPLLPGATNGSRQSVGCHSLRAVVVRRLLDCECSLGSLLQSPPYCWVNDSSCW